MRLEQLRLLIKASNKIFIWAQLSETCSAYFQVSKSTLNEYLVTVATNDDFPVEIDEVGDIYLGKHD